MLINGSKLKEFINKKNENVEHHLNDISSDLHASNDVTLSRLNRILTRLDNLTTQIITIEHSLDKLLYSLKDTQKETSKTNQIIFPFVQNRLDRAEIFNEITKLFDSYFIIKYFKVDYELFIEIFDSQVFLYFNDISDSFVKHESFRLNITPLLEQISIFDVSKISNLDNFTFILNYLSTHVIIDFLELSIRDYIENNLI